MLLKKIVVAEDDDAIAHMVNMALGDAGFLCLRASDGEEALNLVRLHTPDLLILDVMMPRMDGIEVARRIKDDVVLSKTPILMLTALGTVDNKVAGYDAGADDYMTKPFDLREFAAKVKAMIRASTRERGRNPTTNLPGSGAIEDRIDASLAKASDTAVVCFEIADFGAYTDEVGYTRAESLIASLGDLLLEKVRGLDSKDAFLGHMGSTDFIAVVPSGQAQALAEEVVECFDAMHRAWLVEDSPLDALTLSAAIAPIRGIEPGNRVAISDRIVAAMKGAKAQSGSAYVIWRPEDGPAEA
ncbi:EAL domain-containing response regulator [Haliangium sp.]|uniref:response regulator transcription factor n=1 Tax=Haliangium sp. TaxID=2663208 RepID=UPI003D138863